MMKRQRIVKPNQG